MQAWIDGQFKDHTEITVSPLSHCFSRGVAIFEVAPILATPKGAAVLCLKEHVERFFTSAELISMKLPISPEDLYRAVLDTSRQNKVSAGICKFFAYYPTLELKPVPEDDRVSVAIYCANNAEFGFDPKKSSRPVSAGISKYRKLHPETVPFKAKVAGFYVGAYLAAVEMAEKGYDDAIIVDTEGFVCEGGTHSNFFVKNGVIKTAPLHRVLTGTTRRVVIEVAKEAGFEVGEVDIRPDDLTGFDEAFCTGSLMRVAPIHSIEGEKLGTACPGPVTTAIIEAMDKVYGGLNDGAWKWLALVD